MKGYLNKITLATLLICTAAIDEKQNSIFSPLSVSNPKEANQHIKGDAIVKTAVTVSEAIVDLRDAFASTDARKRGSGHQKHKKKGILRKLFKPSTLSRTYVKAKSIGVDLGLVQRRLEPGWADSYSDMALAAKDLFEDYVANGGFNVDDFYTPAEFCEQEGDIWANKEVCNTVLTLMMDFVRNFVLDPWVVVDIIMFWVENLMMLPWEYMLTWENLREFLHSIPKQAFYDDMIPELKDFLCSVGEDCGEVVQFIHEEIVHLLEGELDLSSKPVDELSFNDIIATLVDHYDMEDIGNTVDLVHEEACYVLSLEMVHIDIVSDCEEGSEITRIPFCVSEEYKREFNNSPMFESQLYPDDFSSCTITGSFSEVYDLPPQTEATMENPTDLFSLEDSTEKTCKFLRKRNRALREELCESTLARDVCPSICCEREENPDDKFLARKKNGGKTITCDKLGTMPVDNRKRFCKKKHFFNDEYKPAYIACPETCGLCPF